MDQARGHDVPSRGMVPRRRPPFGVPTPGNKVANRFGSVRLRTNRGKSTPQRAGASTGTILRPRRALGRNPRFTKMHWGVLRTSPMLPEAPVVVATPTIMIHREIAITATAITATAIPITSRVRSLILPTPKPRLLFPPAMIPNTRPPRRPRLPS